MWLVETRLRCQVAIWRGGGEVDWRRLGQLLADRARQDWVLDAKGLPVIGPEGLAELLGAVRRVRDGGCRVAVVGASPAVAAELVSVRLDRLVEFHPHVAGAIAGFAGRRP